MDLNDYRLNAYAHASKISDDKDEKKSEHPKSVSREIRHSSPKGREPLVHKPIFDRINSRLSEISQQAKQDQLEKDNIKQAELAAKTGAWFQKKNATDDDVREAASALTSGGLLKVPGAAGEEDGIYRRVAKFLVIIGVDEAAKIIPHLTEEQTEKIIPEIATIRSIEPEEATQILEEFDSLVKKAREEGGIETARNILTKAYGTKKAEDLLSRSVKFPEGKPFDYLEDADPERIALLISGESVGVQALVLSQIEPKKAAAVINSFDVQKKKDIILRLAKMKPVAPEVLEEINKSLHEKMLTQNTENSRNLDGRGVLAQILKRMSPSAESGIINTLSEQDPELGADLRRRLFTEEDVIGSDDRFIQNKLHSMEDKDIAILIHAKSDDFRNKILKNVSKTRGEIILDEERLAGTILRRDSEAITSAFFSYLRRAWENGDLRVSGRDEDEVYV